MHLFCHPGGARAVRSRGKGGELFSSSLILCFFVLPGKKREGGEGTVTQPSYFASLAAVTRPKKGREKKRGKPAGAYPTSIPADGSKEEKKKRDKAVPGPPGGPRALMRVKAGKRKKKGSEKRWGTVRTRESYEEKKGGK